MLVFLPSLVHAAEDKTEINGLYFDLFDNYGTGTCRFTADFGESGVQSSYTGSITIPGTVFYNNKTYTVTTLGASVFYNTNVTSVYIPNTITAIENLSNVPTMKGIMCNIADPNSIKDSPQSFGKTISESNSNLYKLGSYTDNCVLVVPAGSKSSYTSNGWGKVFKGGIYEGIVIIADNKSMTYGDNRPQLTWSHFKVKSDPINGSPAFSCTATRQSPAGTYDIVITSGNLQTSDITNFKNGTLTINKAPLTITAKSYTINQGDPLPSFECTYSGFKNSETNNVLTTQPSFRCSATSTSAPGTYDIIVSGGYAQNYSMTYVKGTLTILKSIKDLDNSDITIDPIGSVTYNGLTQTPAVIVKDGSTTLTSGTDYTVSYSNNTNAGTATVTVTGKGNYSGTKTASFTINKAALTIAAKSYTINQGDPLPTFECTYSGFKNSETNSVLTTQPIMSCSATLASVPGTYDISVNGAEAENYSITYVKGTLTIVAVTKDMSSSDIAISSISSVTYNGSAQTPILTVMDDNTTLTSGTDYTVSYYNNINAGTATVTVTGIGNYTGTKTTSFIINKAALTITAKSYTINQGDQLPTFECTYSGFVNDEDETVLTTLPTFSCSTTSTSTPGKYDINVSGAAAENYSFNYANGVLTILQSDVLATGISLNETSLTLTAAGQTAVLTAIVAPDDVTDNSVTWSSNNTTIATVSSEGIVTAIANGTAVITAATNDGTNLTADCAVTVNISAIIPDDLAYVDLGLPSGIKWANMNVGAESVEGFGNNYAWGETETKDTYTLDNYKYTSAMTKYNSSDGLMTLESGDDAATVNWGDNWRTPTKTEWEELVNNCTRQWTSVNGVYGYRFKGSNGNSIFIPAWVNNEAGYYWTSTLGRDIRTAYNVDYDQGGIYIDDICFEYYRGDARNVRAVYDHLKCATPTITSAEGKLKFTSATEGVTFVSTVTVGENFTSYEDEVPLTPVYRVSVYAKKEGYEDSEIATKDIDFRALRGDVNDDGEITISDAVGIVNIILENNDSATEE